MLEFMRNKAAYIGLAIVIFFGATMFTGAFFFGGESGNPNVQVSEYRENTFANLGVIPVDERKFIEIANQYFSSLNVSQNSAVDPIMKEQLLWRAFLDAVNYTALVSSAELNKIDVPKQLMDANWTDLMKKSEVSTKRQLKKKLKERNIEYSLIEDRLRKDSLALLMVDGVQSQIEVDNKEVDDLWSQLQIDVIQIPREFDNGVTINANFVYDLLIKGLDFEKAKFTYSTAQSSPKRWVKYGDLSLNIDRVIFNMEKGEISQPIVLPDATYILKLMNRKNTPRTRDFSYEAEKKILLNKNQGRATQAFIESFLTKNPITISNPIIGAVYAKINMDQDAAVAAYQKQINATPIDPIPNYLLGRFYVLSNNPAEAKKQFRWAEIKLMDLAQYKFPFVTIGLLEYYSKEAPEKVAALKKRAIENSKGNEVAIKRLKEVALLLKDKELAKQADELMEKSE